MDQKNFFGFTHHEFDFDGGSCMRFHQNKGMIQDCIFGDDQLSQVIGDGDIKKIIFADASPKEPVPERIEVLIYDHHNNNVADAPEDHNHKTAFDIMLEAVGPCGLDEQRLAIWSRLVQLGDQKSEADDMDIMRALKKVHALLESDSDAYVKWFSPLFDSFFSVDLPDIDRALKIVQESIDSFFSDHQDSPAGKFVQKWLDRSRNKEKILRSTPRNFVHFLAYMNEKDTQECMKLLLEAYHQEQSIFQDCKKEFNRARFEFYGDTLVISAITSNPKFVQVSRYMVFSKNEEIAPIVREKIKGRDSMWMIMVLNPKNKNFQIFINDNMLRGQKLMLELAKAMRAEIIIKRSGEIPDVDLLSEGGSLEGTMPLYYHKLESGYPALLWGSFKHPSKITPVEFGETSSSIHARLIEIIKLALDENSFAENCNPKSCEDCLINSWRLKKCHEKRN